MYSVVEKQRPLPKHTDRLLTIYANGKGSAEVRFQGRLVILQAGLESNVKVD